VLRGEAPFEKIDVIHRAILEDVLKQFKVATLTEEEKARLNLVWHRLKPWPDAVRGLKRLRSKFIVATLSNGNTSLLVDMAKHGGLPWDCVFSSDTFKLFKPDPGMYLGAASMLDLKPEEVMMVAAHKPDLRAAAKCGLKTAFVKRPLERGRGAALDLTPEPDFTLNAESFLDLADQLGC
jgi:2-haloacid dehalogenase